MKSYYIHLIRHGEINETLEGQYIGMTDVLLSQKGILELKDLTRNFKYPEVQLCFTSPMKRCTQTMDIIYPNVKSIEIDGLKECNFGDWEGKTAKQLENNSIFKEWISNSKNVSPPNGENSMVFANRVCSTFENLVLNLMKSGTTQSAVITHGGVIMTLLAAYGLPRANYFDWITKPGCGYSIRITPGLWMRDTVFEVYEKIPYDYV